MSDSIRKLIYYKIRKLIIQGSYSSGKTWKKGFFEKKNQGKPRKLRKFLTIFITSGNFILPDNYDQIGGALRINE